MQNYLNNFGSGHSGEYLCEIILNLILLFSILALVFILFGEREPFGNLVGFLKKVWVKSFLHESHGGPGTCTRCLCPGCTFANHSLNWPEV